MVYDPDPIALFHKAVAKKNDPNMIEEMKFTINEVKAKHTYINRVNALLEAIERLGE